MTPAVDPLIPVSITIRRLERCRDEIIRAAAQLHFWEWRKRFLMLGAISAYQIEIDELLEIGGKCQPIWEKV